MPTQRQIISNIAAGVVICIFVLFMAGIIFPSSASKRGSFVDRESRRIVEVPRSWGKPVSICRRPITVTILFENGHVITVGHGFIGFGKYFYTVQIVYVDDSS